MPPSAMPARIFFRETRLFAQQRRESGRCGPLVMRRPPMPEPPQPSDGGRRHLQVCPFRARAPSRWEQFVAAGYLPIGLVNEKLTFQIRPVAGPQVQRIGGAGVRDGYAHEHSVGYGFRQAAAATHDRKPVGHDRRKQLLKCGPPPLFVGGDRNRSAFGCDPVCHSRQRHVRTFFRTDGWPHLHILRIDRDVGTCRVVRRWTRRFLSFRHTIPPLPPEDGRGQASRRYAMRRLAGRPRALQILSRDCPPLSPLPLLTLALDDGACGAVRERAKHGPDLYMRPPAASRRGNVALVELCGDGIEARGAGLLDLSDDRQEAGGGGGVAKQKPGQEDGYPRSCTVTGAACSRG